MRNKTMTSAKKKVISTLTAATCILSVSAPAMGSTWIGNAVFGNSIVASALAYNEIKTEIPVGSRVMIWPLPTSNNTITGCFSDGRQHGAIDISAAKGTSVYAVADGTVVDCGYGNGYGNRIVIEHKINGNTIYTQYSHLSSYIVNKGQKVKQKDIIGYTGDTDSPKSYHLDFQVKRVAGFPGPSERMSRNIDPCKVLQLPSTLKDGATSNYQEVKEYIQDMTHNDRCPNQFRKFQPGSLQRTLQCELSPHKLGRRDGDAWHANVSMAEGWMVYGPYEKYSTGQKAVVFRLKTDFNTDKVYTNLNNRFMDEVVCTIQVADNSNNGKELAKMDIRRSDFFQSETWQDFNLYFNNTNSNHKLEFRIYYHKKAAIWGDKVDLRQI